MQADIKEKLRDVARDVLTHAQNGSHRLAPAVMTINADTYTDEARFQREKRGIFHRLPLLLATTCELRAPGDYKAVEVAGVPVLLARDKEGVVRAFLNICTHRAAILAEGSGNASRFTCPYHGWTFTSQGKLMGITSRSDFGEVDMAALGLRQFPLLEKSGLIWVVLDPESTLDIATFLSGHDELLDAFGFDRWHCVDSRTLKGANWKLAFDAHLEFYHLPVLHKNTFGPNIAHKPLYYFSGPHQRLIRTETAVNRVLPEHANLFGYIDKPEPEWPVEAMVLGEWILFPHVSINSFYNGGRGVIISQIFPGETVDQSITIQTYLMEKKPDEAARAEALKLCDFLAKVVNEEDLPTSLRQQRALAAGLLPTVCYGRNEEGLQHFHRWIEQIVTTDDPGLNTLFGSGLDATTA